MDDRKHEILAEIRERLVRVETKLDGIGHIEEEAHKAKRLAADAYALSKFNSDRIDVIDRIIFWMGTTVFGAIILAVLGLLFTGGS